MNQCRLPRRVSGGARHRPWRIPANGLVPISEYLGLPPGHVTEADHEGVGLEFYAAVLEKP